MIERHIYLIRGRKVMLDRDLADLYRIETFNLNKAVKRNFDRFPEDFMFRLAPEETKSLRFQIGMSKPNGRGGRRSLPYAFTEQGVAMLSSVLKSKQAIAVNIAIMRVFTRLREMLSSHAMLLRRLDELEKEQKKHGLKIAVVFEAIRKMGSTDEAEEPKSPIGFRNS
jgi:ORF6N domain